MINTVGFLSSFLLAFLITPFVIKLSKTIGAIDKPGEESRKIHKRIMPRAGGLAIYGAFIVVSLILLPTLSRGLVGLFCAGTMVLLLGLVDDIYRLSPWVKLLFQIIIALIAAVGFDITIEAITNPLGGVIALDGWQVALDVFGRGLVINVWAVLFSVFWLVGMTNTVNFLDGLDGLATGVSAIAALIIFILSIGVNVNQPTTALASIILAGSCLGYLKFNFFPAKIFNGDSGAYFLGMTLGILAIFSGGKLATALLVLGLPILDAVWAIMRRLLKGRSPFKADRGHLHYLMLDSGLPQRQVVLIIYSFTIVFGSIALFASTRQKFYAIIMLTIMLVLLVATFALIKYKKTAKLDHKQD